MIQHIFGLSTKLPLPFTLNPDSGEEVAVYPKVALIVFKKRAARCHKDQITIGEDHQPLPPVTA